METLKIEMVHDVVCSWYPIGYSHMKKALHRLNIKADFHFLPYELNPDMSEKGESIDRFFERRHQWDQSKLLNYQGKCYSGGRVGWCKYRFLQAHPLLQQWQGASIDALG